jgi:hypothetical protein
MLGRLCEGKGGVLNIDHELDRQCEALLLAGVPDLVGLGEAMFSDAVGALLPALRDCVSGDRSPARAPFVLVVSGGAARDMAAAEQLVPLLRLEGGSVPGVLDRNHGEQGLAPYRPIDEVGPPPASVYALVDVERGEQFRGVPPQEALPRIYARDRTPLTIPEGIALVLLHPQVLERNACFMLSGSRRGDRRVPALWISGKAPKLGWCWDGNPHTWLGVASTGARVAARGAASGSQGPLTTPRNP